MIDRGRWFAALFTCICACSGAARPAVEAVEVAHEPTSPAPPPITTPPPPPASVVEVAPPPPTTADEPIVPPDRTYTVLTFADGDVSAGRPLRIVSHTSTVDETTLLNWQDVAHPNAVVRRAIARWAYDFVHQFVDGSGSQVDCEIVLADPGAVAMSCRYDRVIDRDGCTEPVVAGAAVRVDGETLVPIDVSSSMVARTGFRAGITERCIAQAIEGFEGTWSAHTAQRWARERCTHPLIIPTRRSLQMIYAVDTRIVTVDIPWSELRDGIRADGAFASFLPSVGTHEIVVAGADALQASLELDCTVRFAVTDALSWDELLRAYVGVGGPPGGYVLETSPGHGRLLLETCVPDEQGLVAARDTARAIAATLHSRAERIEAPATASIETFQNAEPVQLRDQPNGEGTWLAWLPDGAILARIDGSLDIAPSQSGGFTYLHVAVNDHLSGWCSGRTLSGFPADRRPSLATLLGGLSEAERTQAARDAIVGVTPWVAGFRPPYAFVVATLTTPAPTVIVGLAPRARNAELPAPTVYARAEGTFEHVRVLRAPPDDAYVLLATRIAGASEGMVRWHLFAPGASTAGWTLDAPTSQTLPEQARARLETDAQRQVHGHTWLASFRMPDHSVVRVRVAHGAFVEERAAR